MIIIWGFGPGLEITTWNTNFSTISTPAVDYHLQTARWSKSLSLLGHKMFFISIIPFSSRSRTKSTASWLVITFHIPSQARIINSSSSVTLWYFISKKNVRQRILGGMDYLEMQLSSGLLVLAWNYLYTYDRQTLLISSVRPSLDHHLNIFFILLSIKKRKNSTEK